MTLRSHPERETKRSADFERMREAALEVAATLLNVPALATRTATLSELVRAYAECYAVNEHELFERIARDFALSAANEERA
jgi:hypothetical protein